MYAKEKKKTQAFANKFEMGREEKRNGGKERRTFHKLSEFVKKIKNKLNE